MTILHGLWTLSAYRTLISRLSDRGLAPLNLDEFSTGRAGVWLRHDVELSISAAREMAGLEARLEVPSTYFICVESPLLVGDPGALHALINDLLDLGREVSFHVLLAHGQAGIPERLHQLARDYPRVTPRALTFHAPGIGSRVLAQLPLGAIVYGPLAKRSVRYFSDSTGRWRWGDPHHAEIPSGSTIQLLTHPFWWSGTHAVVELPRTFDGPFLPQLVAAKEGAEARDLGLAPGPSS